MCDRAKGVHTDLDLLDHLWSLWAELGRGLDTAAWQKLTRLDGWRMTELYAHVGRGVGVLRQAIEEPTLEPAEHKHAAAYFATFRPWAREAAHLVDKAARDAAASAGCREMVRWFAEDGPRTIAAVRGAGGITVATVAGTIALSDYVLTRVVEAGVHLLDARSAVPDAPLPTLDALHRVADVLVELAGPVDFIEAATGRSARTLFPVLT